MSFLAELSERDLMRLRSIVRVVHFKEYPTEFVTDYEADRVIESVGPEVAAKIVRQYVDRGLVE
jgi:hypothetical protein